LDWYSVMCALWFCDILQSQVRWISYRIPIKSCVFCESNWIILIHLWVNQITIWICPSLSECCLLCTEKGYYSVLQKIPFTVWHNSPTLPFWHWLCVKKTSRGNVTLPNSMLNTTILLVNERGNRKHILLTVGIWHCSRLMITLPCHLLLCAVSNFQNRFFKSVQFSSTFLLKMPSSISSTITFLMIHILNQNRPTIFFIQHHLVCSHLAVVYNGTTVSMETAQMVLNQ